MSTFESTGKIVSNVMEAKRRVAGPLINSSVETLNKIKDSHILDNGLGKVQIVLESSARKSSQISKALAKSASAISRNSKSLKTNDTDRDDSDTSDDLNNSLASILDSSGRLMRKLISTMITSVKIIGDVVEAKRKVLEPIVENTARSLKALSDSNAIERSLKTAQSLANAGVQASIGVSTALARAGSATTPVLVQGFNTANDVTLRVIRLGICSLICPHQEGDEKESCEKENCGQINENKSSKKDENDDLQ